MAQVAQSPVPEAALKDYAGKWVAVRGGEVIAAADTFEDLVKDDRVEQMDALYLVPSSSTYFY